MFKRANKMTALLVAAAAVVSLVPATGVNAADVKRVESKDGTIYNAVAYKDGKAYIDGEVNDKDEAVYYLSDGKYTELEDVDSSSDIKLYGEKYVDVDGDYFVDLENGKVTDDDVRDDDQDDAASVLRKKVKNDTDGRYMENGTAVSGSYLSDDVPDLDKNDSILPSASFGENWYQTKYSAKSVKDTQNDSADTFNVYTDAKGNYIDADYNLGKLKVKTDAKTVNIENTNDGYDANNDDAVRASVRSLKVLGQDKNYIYRLATVKVKVDSADSAKIEEISGMEIATTTSGAVTYKDAFNTTDAKIVEMTVIQKISKAQDSDDVDGIKYAKTVTNYVVSDDDASDIDQKVFKDSVDNIVNGSTDNTEYTVVNGKIIAYVKSDKDVKTQTISLKTKSGYNYTDVADEGKESVEIDEDDNMAVQVDVDGNLWRLDGGAIYQWDNDEDWDKVYKVDGSFDKLSVYNKDNMVAWNEDDETYSIIGAKEDKKEVEKPAVTTGWAQATDGTWTYVNADGTKATGWTNLNGAWYFMNSNGVMATGWVAGANGTWYYTNASGAMQTGWVAVGGSWYFMNGSGAMQTGWVNDNGTWYFCNASGAMQANTTVNGYTLGANGAWIR